MNDPTCFVNMQEYYHFIYAISYMMIAEIVIWLYNFKGWIKKPQISNKDCGTLLLVIFACWSSFSISTFFRCGYITELIGEILIPHCFFYLGLFLLVLGTTLRSWAVWTLKHSFTLSAKINSTQGLVTTGIYRYVRNPAYVGTILCLLGTAFCFRSAIAPVLVLIICFVCYGIRIQIEERALRLRFGSDFDNYCAHTWRLIPFIW